MTTKNRLQPIEASTTFSNTSSKTKEDSIIHSTRKLAIIVGILYIIGTVAGISSMVFTDPIRSAQNYLLAVSANETQLILGAMAVLVMGLALAMVPVTMFPVLKRQNEVLALGYIVFRGALETVGYIAVTVNWLLLVPLSDIYIEAGAPDMSEIQSLSAVLFNADEIGSIMTIIFCLGALMFYTMLFQSRLVPRWLSGWGLIALIPYIAVPFLKLFATIDPDSSLPIIMDLPLAIQEMVLAVWLIVKGFNHSAIASLYEK